MDAGLIGIAVALVLMIAGMPVAYVLALVGIVGIWSISDLRAALALSGQTAFDTVTNPTLVVLPLFVLMGNVLGSTGMARELYHGFDVYLGRRRGGLAMATILSCGAFSAVCGSSLATTATMARVAIPSMTQYGYNPGFSAGVVAAGGTLGILIPPSVALIIYGILTETNIGHLFVAGVVPGLIGVAGYLAAVLVATARRPDLGGRNEAHSGREKLLALKGFGPVLLLLLFIILGIYLGVFTATEAAGMGAGFALLLALVRRQLGWGVLADVLYQSARTSALMLFLLIGAVLFSHFLETANFSRDLAAFVIGLDASTATVIAVVLVIYIILGCFLESLSMILLTVPIFYPIMKDFGVDLVWFGVLIVVVTEIALITPPIGMNIFVLRSVLPEIPIKAVFRGVVPFIIADFVRLAIVAIFPGLSLFLVIQMG